MMSPPDPIELRDRLDDVREAIRRAAMQAGRDVDEVRLIAVSKTYPASSVQALLDHGHRDFGENRVQEAADKFTGLRPAFPDLRLHLIGALQTNKAVTAATLAGLIHSLDRPSLLRALLQADVSATRFLVQVNTGHEPQKAGIVRDDADTFIQQCQERLGPALCGLMCIPPREEDPGPHFAWLAACAERHHLPELSMGMSADYQVAIAHGATMVRIGQAIFGARG